MKSCYRCHSDEIVYVDTKVCATDGVVKRYQCQDCGALLEDLPSDPVDVAREARAINASQS